MFPKDDATHTYRGYRLQALYILHRILITGENILTFQPEGKEDLAIYAENDVLLEIVQVKAHDNAITLSSFKPKKPDSFFYRVNDILDASPNVQVTIASFNSFGQRFSGAVSSKGSDRDREVEKLSGYEHIDEGGAQKVFAAIQLEQVVEDNLYHDLETWTQDSLVGEPSTAIDLLQYWIYLCSETKQKITFTELRQKLDKVGEYINQRAAFQREWYTTIEPLIEKELPHPSEELAAEFYRGISAKYDHILANLDVIRPQKLELIHQAFQDSQVVILHGISGQGKSTLAFRYLHDYVSDQFRFYVHSPENRNQALSIARAISGQAQVMNFPIMLHIDVRPSETNWTDTVRQLVRLPNIYILVTIREDDLRRAQFDDTDFSFETIELRLEHDEANQIYDYFVEAKQPPDFTDFNDTWRKFTADTSSSPLMEFVYLLTQGESLQIRLKRQIQILEDEVIANKFEESLLDLLRLISIASAYGVRLDRRTLAEKLKLKVPRRVFGKLEKEYLIRAEDILVDGVHPVRSQMLQELLTVDAPPWEKDISILLSCMHEPDLGFFLLNLFVSKPELSKVTIAQLSRYSPKTWDGIAGILRALVWLGIRNFVYGNETTLRQAHERFGIGALMFLNSDLLGAAENSQVALENLAEKNDAIAISMVDAKALSTQMQGVDDVLTLAQRWLKSYVTSMLDIKGFSNWNSLTETIFWCRHFEITQLETSWMPVISDGEQLNQLSIADLANLSLALSHKQGIISWHDQQADYLLQRFMDETLTFAIDKNDPSNPQLHFIFDYETMEDKDGDEKQNSINNEAVKRVRYFLYLFPEYERVGCQGYGHRVHNLDIHDESYKTGISRMAFPMKWLVWGNSIYIGLFYWLLRDDDWQVLAGETIELRRKIVKTLTKYEREIDKYFASRKAYNLFDRLAKKYNQEMIQTLTSRQLLPKTAVDPWGFITESEQKNHESKVVRPKGILIEVLKPYWTSIRKYVATLQNFFTQSQHPLMLTSADFRVSEPEAVDRLYELIGSNAQHLGRLSVHNLTEAMYRLRQVQVEFRSLMQKFVNPIVLNRLEKNELETMQRLHALWCYFVFEPFQVERSAKARFFNALSNKVQQVESQIVASFQNSLPQAQVTLLNQRVIFEDQSYSVLILDQSDGLDLYSTITQQLPQISKSVLEKIERWSPTFYAVERDMPHLFIILLVEGRLLIPAAYRVMPTMFALQSEPKPINFVPLPLTDEVMSQLKPLGVRLHHEREAILSRDLFVNYATLQALLAHMIDILQAELQDEAHLDQDVIQKYYEKWFARLQEEGKKSLEITAQINDFIHELKFESQDVEEFTIGAFDTVLAQREILKPIVSGSSGIGLDEMLQWKEMLDQLVDYIFFLQIKITRAAQYTED